MWRKRSDEKIELKDTRGKNNRRFRCRLRESNPVICQNLKRFHACITFLLGVCSPWIWARAFEATFPAHKHKPNIKSAKVHSNYCTTFTIYLSFFFCYKTALRISNIFNSFLCTRKVEKKSEKLLSSTTLRQKFRKRCKLFKTQAVTLPWKINKWTHTAD